MLYGNLVVVAADRFFGANQGVNVQHTALPHWQLYFNDVQEHLVEITHTENFAQAIDGTVIRFQVQIFQSRALLRRQFQREIRT